SRTRPELDGHRAAEVRQSLDFGEPAHWSERRNPVPRLLHVHACRWHRLLGGRRTGIDWFRRAALLHEAARALGRLDGRHAADGLHHTGAAPHRQPGLSHWHARGFRFCVSLRILRDEWWGVRRRAPPKRRISRPELADRGTARPGGELVHLRRRARFDCSIASEVSASQVALARRSFWPANRQLEGLYCFRSTRNRASAFSFSPRDPKVSSEARAACASASAFLSD